MSAESERFAAVRDLAVQIGQVALVLSVRELETWISQVERAMVLGPVVDPTIFRDNHEELEKQLKFMRALLEFRKVIDEIG